MNESNRWVPTIEPAGSAEAIAAAGDLFDNPPDAAAGRRFLDSPDHHLLLAYDDGHRPVGFVSGVETTHPDKGTEMFLYEAGVAEQARGHGVATTLVRALAGVARQRGCYAMWVLTEPDNAAANKLYRAAGAQDVEDVVMYSWDLTPGGASAAAQ